MADEPWTILRVLNWTQRHFTERGLPTPRLDAEVLLAHALQRDRVGLYTHHDQPLDPAELAGYRELIQRRLGGEPVAYLVGQQEFWSLPFSVDRRVLIPRPETETLVEVALELLEGCAQPTVADIGTGSGAIAIAIAHERSDARMIAVDRSMDALAVAGANAAANGVEVEFRQGDLLRPLADLMLDLVVSNPPYIAEGDFVSLPAEVKCEPREALLSGPDGLDAIRRIAAEVSPLLATDGAVAIEVGAGQATSAAELFHQQGLTHTTTRRDLLGIERVVIARR